VKNEEENKQVARKYYQMGNVYYKMQDYQTSIESYECVLTLVPYSLLTRYHLARSYDAIGYYSKAREQYKWVIASDSDDAKQLKLEIKKRVKDIEGFADKVVVKEDEIEVLRKSESEELTQKTQIEKLEKDLIEVKKSIKKLTAGGSVGERKKKKLADLEKKEKALSTLQGDLQKYSELIQEGDRALFLKTNASTKDAIAKYESALTYHINFHIFLKIANCYEMLEDYHSALKYYQKYLIGIDKIDEYSAKKKALAKGSVQKKIVDLTRLIEQIAEYLHANDSKDADNFARMEDDPRSAAYARKHSITNKWWFWTGLGLTTTFGIVALTSGLQVMRLNKSLKEEWTQENNKEYEFYKDVGDASLGISLISAVALTVGIVVNSRMKMRKKITESTTQTMLIPVCDSRSCMFSLTFDF